MPWKIMLFFPPIMLLNCLLCLAKEPIMPHIEVFDTYYKILHKKLLINC